MKTQSSHLSQFILRSLKVVVTALTLAMTLSLNLVMASGSGDYGGTKKTTNEDYDIGKKVFQEQVICDACPHAGMALDSDSVREILPELEKGGEIGQFMSYRDRKSVQYFLKQRFSL